MLEKLDISQKQFCESKDTNIRLLAPAGCGKTLSLLFRCAHLAENSEKQRPKFLIVTFTVAAKCELLARLNENNRFSAIRDNTEITTLNSWGFRRIKNVAYSPKLLTSKEDYHFAMKNMLQPIWKEHERIKAAIDQNSYQTPRKLMDLMDAFKSIGFDHVRQYNYELFVKRINELRDQGLKPKIDEMLDGLVKIGVLLSITNQKGEEQAKTGDREVYNAFFRFWKDATQHLIDSATFTLEDQKYFAYLDERQKLEEGKYLSGAAQYNHVLVDEFQDINPLDLALIKVIVARNKASITIVGDDDQAIFEWRGATPEYILNPNPYLEANFSTFTLATNYRSPKNIVELSQILIANNNRRVNKLIRPSRNDNAQIEVRKTNSLDEAMRLVYSEVQRSIGQGQSPSHVVIIGRKRSQIIPYQIFFASKDVSFCAAEDLQVFMSKAFERLLNLIMIKSRRDLRQLRSEISTAILELCNFVKRYPLNKNDREKLRRYLNQADISTLSNGVDALANYSGPLKGPNQNGIVSLSIANAIKLFLNAKTVADSLIEMGANFEGLQIDLGKAEDDIFYTDPPFFHLAEYAIRYGDDYLKFVKDIERAKDQLTYIPPFEDDTQTSSIDELWKRPLHLMTALRAKGKEFDSVILLDVNDGIWPNKNAITLEQKEAERRVFYVAFTRARKRVLMLVSSKFGNKEALPSPYISELGFSTR
jgi:DNA helicase-2/ATP-dependent DNA helicase PcrA